MAPHTTASRFLAVLCLFSVNFAVSVGAALTERNSNLPGHAWGRRSRAGAFARGAEGMAVRPGAGSRMRLPKKDGEIFLRRVQLWDRVLPGVIRSSKPRATARRLVSAAAAVFVAASLLWSHAIVLMCFGKLRESEQARTARRRLSESNQELGSYLCSLLGGGGSGPVASERVEMRPLSEVAHRPSGLAAVWRTRKRVFVVLLALLVASLIAVIVGTTVSKSPEAEAPVADLQATEGTGTVQVTVTCQSEEPPNSCKVVFPNSEEGPDFGWNPLSGVIYYFTVSVPAEFAGCQAVVAKSMNWLGEKVYQEWKQKEFKDGYAHTETVPAIRSCGTLADDFKGGRK